uniref:Fatty acid 2-hydroxylase n=1 Tax=Glossina palpalis gambiensis TaxID=67801 RepID=A0A1B0BAP2_9MUSC
MAKQMEKSSNFPKYRADGQSTFKEKNDDKFIVKYRKNFYDIKKFIVKHPGGVNTLKGLNNSDMTSRFIKAHPHSDAAMYLMKEYHITKPTQLLTTTTCKSNDYNIKDAQYEKLIVSSMEDSNNNIIDENVEHLVDWSRAMLPQIGKICKQYEQWVHKPVDRSLRLFGPWYLEMCTKTAWWVVPIFWLPVIGALIYNEMWDVLFGGNVLKILSLLFYFLLGIIFWTFLEYVLHRYLFHMSINKRSHPLLCSFHFMIHGLHHKVPFDSMRLVFPPLPGAILAIIIYAPLSMIVPQPRVILAGALFGYLCYDMMHYYLHYGDPSNRLLYHMKRYHYQHHFAHQNLGFGISTPLWDTIFNTRIHLRKLRFRLKWK